MLVRAPNRRDALDDFTQDVLLRVYANRDRLRDEDRLPQWIAAIARNTARSWNRQRLSIPVEMIPERADERPTPLNQATDAERWAQVSDALDTLDPFDRDLIVTYHLNDRDYDALRRETGLSYTAARSRLHRARERLRRRLGGWFVGVAAFIGWKSRAEGEDWLMVVQKNRTPLSVAAAVTLHLLVGAGLLTTHLARTADAEPTPDGTAQAGEQRVMLVAERAEVRGENGTMTLGENEFATVDIPLREIALRYGLTLEGWFYLDAPLPKRERFVLFAQPGWFSFELVTGRADFDYLNEQHKDLYLNEPPLVSSPDYSPFLAYSAFHSTRTEYGVQYQEGGGTGYEFSNDDLPIGEWFHLAVQIDPVHFARLEPLYYDRSRPLDPVPTLPVSYMQLTLNGKLLSNQRADTFAHNVGPRTTKQQIPVNLGYPLYIGGSEPIIFRKSNPGERTLYHSWGVHSHRFPGKIADVRISNKPRYPDDGLGAPSTRSDLRIADMIADPPRRLESDDFTVALWRFDEGGDSPTYADASGNGYTLTRGKTNRDAP